MWKSITFQSLIILLKTAVRMTEEHLVRVRAAAHPRHHLPTLNERRRNPEGIGHIPSVEQSPLVTGSGVVQPAHAKEAPSFRDGAQKTRVAVAAEFHNKTNGRWWYHMADLAPKPFRVFASGHGNISIRPYRV